jgi:hypothetical protein
LFNCMISTCISLTSFFLTKIEPLLLCCYSHAHMYLSAAAVVTAMSSTSYVECD